MRIFSRRLLPLLLSGLSLVALLCVDLKGYATNGHAWGTNQVLYYVNPNSIWLSPSAVLSAIQSGAQAWSSQTHANIQLVYAGSTNGSSLTLNNKNEVFLRNDSNGFVGETYWWYDGSGHLVDADTVFHEGGYRFYAGSGCSGSAVYLEDVAIHELGHSLGLAHSSVANVTMEPTMPGYCDFTQMSLESDDIAGIESLYPPTSTGKNTAPSVNISSPGNGSSFSSGASVTFSGSAIDNQDGNLSSSLGWTSSVEGFLGYGASLNRVLSTGSHTITASIRDSGGLLGSAQITVNIAAASPSSVSPDGTVVPTVSQIVDNAGGVWTIGSGGAILRNGTSAAGGIGSQILWKSSTIYVLGTDANWWQWTGASWINVGRTVPGGINASLDGTTVPINATQIIDYAGAVWTIGSGGAILRNGISAAGGFGSQILWKSSSIYVLGTDANWWQWIGSSWINVGRTIPGGTNTSPDGTTVPVNATQIIDNGGAVWTIGSGSAILRNGTWAAGGFGSQILWQSSTIYVLGTDANWWQWTGSGWINVGRTTPGGTNASPDGTTVPTNAMQIIDNGAAVWTIGSGGTILRNGSWAAGGKGSQILWTSNTIYVFGTDANWWRWTGSGWTNVGPVKPGGSGVSADGTMVPVNASQIIDTAGAVWTIGSGQLILRNGSSVAGGLGSMILWRSGTIYVLGTDSNWWRWTGSTWLNAGPIQP